MPEPQELKITMLGASGVGKTSLLTAIFAEFEGTAGDANIDLVPDDESLALFQKRLTELRSLTKTFLAKGGVSGTSTIRSFFFNLGTTGKSPTLRLNFQDYPGGYMETTATVEEKASVKKLLTDSVSALLTIDAAALMEEDGQWHDQINRPMQMTSLFKAAYQNLDGPRLVILTPVKCEAYMQRRGETNVATLISRIRAEYAPLLRYLGSESLRQKVAVVILPVQTVGNVVFSRIEVEEDIDGREQPQFYFRRKSFKSKYKPQDSEQPLLYLLRFLLKMHVQRKRFPGLGWIRNLFGMDAEMLASVEQLQRRCKVTDGFTVIQGERLLQID